MSICHDPTIHLDEALAHVPTREGPPGGLVHPPNADRHPRPGQGQRDGPRWTPGRRRRTGRPSRAKPSASSTTSAPTTAASSTAPATFARIRCAPTALTSTSQSCAPGPNARNANARRDPRQVTGVLSTPAAARRDGRGSMINARSVVPIGVEVDRCTAGVREHVQFGAARVDKGRRFTRTAPHDIRPELADGHGRRARFDGQVQDHVPVSARTVPLVRLADPARRGRVRLSGDPVWTSWW
jgi:hypothetical protein